MEKLLRIWKTKEVRKSLLFVLFILVVFRVLAHIPVPGVDTEALAKLFQGNQFFGLLNIFSGGTLENFSVVAMGVAPYITASIVFQLLAMIIPSLEEMQKEEQGRQRINQWTRYLTVPLALSQAYGLTFLLRSQSGAAGVFTSPDPQTLLFMMVTMTAGTIFLMWLGELISEQYFGNGISILIFAGIVAGFPSLVSQAIAVYDPSQLMTLILFAVIAIATVVGVVVMNEAQRKVPIQYARHAAGSRLSGGVSTHLPMRLNMGGVIPIIFAISVLLFPNMIAQFFLNARTEFLRQAAEWVMRTIQDPLIYAVAYFVLVFAFSYFYTSVIFHPDRVAENIQKQGGFIPGIRPGKPTAEYLGAVSTRLLLVGASFLSLIAILPLILPQFTGNQSLAIGGTSVLIVVSVLIETVKKVEAQLTMREYEY